MKSTDIRIIQYIRNNARMNLTTLSRKTGIPVSTIFDRLKTQEGDCIRKFTAILDFAKMGFPIRTTILLKASAQHRDTLKHFLIAHDRVNTVLRVNNGFDFAVECFFTNIQETEEFVEMLEMRFGVIGKQVLHIIEEIAREKAMMVEIGG